MLFSLYLFILGLFLGSFLLVVINRFCTGKNFINGRSECEYCGHTLSWLDLIPVVSFVFLQGKCRYCHKELSLLYPLSEIGTALFFTFSLTQLYHLNTLTFSLDQVLLLLFTLYLLSTFILTFFIDIKIGIIPFFVVIPCILLLLLRNVVFPPVAAPYFIFSGVGSFLFLFSIFGLTKGRGMGFGTVSLRY